MQRTQRQRLSLPLLSLVVLLLFAACGSDAATPTPTAEGRPYVQTHEFAPSGEHWRTDLPVGASTGQIAFATPVTLEDGSTATLEELADGRPLLLYFFAITWPVCNAEFRTLGTLYPEFQDDVALVAVGFRSSESVEDLNAHKEREGYPGVFVEGPSQMVSDFRVTVQSTKFGISADGVVLFEEGYGQAPAEVWRSRLQGLAGT